MSRYEQETEAMRYKPQRWLVTGAAVFTGSHLHETIAYDHRRRLARPDGVAGVSGDTQECSP